ncbi:MAG: HEPN domain-containing protein [Pseudomonadota bacterium]
MFTTEKDGLVAADFLHGGLDHMTAAKLLFKSDDPSHFDSAGYLAHMAVELLVKSWLLEVAGEFEGIHNLQSLYDVLQKKYGVVPLDDEQQQVLKMLDQFEQLRYPNPKQPTEIGDEDLPRIEALVGHLCRSMPKTIPEALEKIEPGRKGGRVLMRKKVE